MKSWHSISTRLVIMLVGLTLGSLAGLSLVLDAALKNFFVRDALATLRQQSDVFAAQAPSEWNSQKTMRQWTELVARQGRWQVIVLDSVGRERIRSEGVTWENTVELPAELIPQIMTGSPQQGRFWVGDDTQYPWWLYGSAPIFDRHSSKAVGAVYMAMPMRRPKQFAQEVRGVVIGMLLSVTSLTLLAAWLFSRSFTQPLARLYQQTKGLEAGDYTVRSRIQGKGEFAQLSHSLDEMADKLSATLEALKAQETCRRQLVANVSHDLRTPLASLRVELEAILDGVVSGKKAQQYLHRACRETDYLASLVSQLLFLARADAGQLQVQPQAVSAVAIAQECLSGMELTAQQAELHLELKAVSLVPQVWVDPELTGQVVLNLLDNAIKYAPESQVISLEVLTTVEQNQQKYVPLQIRDRGAGMKPEVIQKATERFYRADRARPRGGLGLGLAIAKEICQLQGGYLQIESQPEQGTVVRLLLPTSENQSNQNSQLNQPK